MTVEYTYSHAMFSRSDDRYDRHRYYLLRDWHTVGLYGDPGPPCYVLWLMLNPSKADKYNDDPTIRKCVGFTMRQHHKAMIAINLFTLIDTNQKSMLRMHPSQRNDEFSDVYIKDCLVGRYNIAYTICAWGDVAERSRQSVIDRASEVLAMIPGAKFCLGKTKSGFPRHPSRLSYNSALEEFSL